MRHLGDMLSEIELNKFGDGRVFVLCVVLVSPVLSSSSCRTQWRGGGGGGSGRRGGGYTTQNQKIPKLIRSCRSDFGAWF